jgi:hypothetical protein
MFGKMARHFRWKESTVAERGQVGFRGSDLFSGQWQVNARSQELTPIIKKSLERNISSESYPPIGSLDASCIHGSSLLVSFANTEEDQHDARAIEIGDPIPDLDLQLNGDSR